MNEGNKDKEAEGIKEVGKAWKSTCRVLLGEAGEDIGDLLEYRDYLKRYTDPTEHRKSHISGKDVIISSNRVPKDARVIANDERMEYEKRTASLPLDINDIKDMDSLVGAVREKACYAGNIVLGNSRGALDCHRCVNTNYSLECQDVYDAKYCAFTTSIRSPEYSFGCCFGGDIQFCIKVLDPYKQIRCMETFHCNVASDCYYSASLEDSANCMFSFNQRAKNYLIGNVQLARERYAALKAKLIAEIADTLKRKKAVPSVIEIIKGDGGDSDG